MPEEYAGASVKTFLRQCRGVSGRLLSQCKKTENGLLKNGRPVWAAEATAAGDVISLAVDRGHNCMEPEKLPVSVVWEDAYFLVLDKPAGMPVHPCPGHDKGTLCNFVSFYQKEKGEDWAFRPLNRLDKDTSGLVIGAKDPYSAAAVKTVKKTYFGICEGSLIGKGVVDGPIRLKAGHGIQREIGQGGKPAVTHWEALASGGGHTLLSLELDTGRTHQIRVHLSGIGHPLAGDDFYGGGRNFLSRQALHCAKAEWTHPVDGSKVLVKAPLPEDILRFLEFLNIHITDISGDTFISRFESPEEELCKFKG